MSGSKSVRTLREFMTSDKRLIQAHLQRFVCPIFGADVRGRLEPIGSGVLFKVLSMPFLWTAAHVIDELATTTLYVPGRDNQMAELAGTNHSTAAPSTGRDKNHLDAGLFLLDDHAANELGLQGCFLGPDDLQVDGPPVSNEHYAFIGYPVSRNRPRLGNTVRLTNLMVHVSGISEERTRHMELDPQVHIVGNFDRSALVLRPTFVNILDLERAASLWRQQKRRASNGPFFFC
jgi:hypothetical protein